VLEVCAPFALALFALSVMPRRPVRRWILAAAACGACLSYYPFLLAADIAARQTLLPIAASVWLPNLVFAVASTALMVAAQRDRAHLIRRNGSRIEISVPETLKCASFRHFRGSYFGLGRHQSP
jgi:hypothetical protein